MELSTYEGYITYFDRHLIPYFEEKKLTVQQIKPYDIHQFVEYKLHSGRCDNKPGGLSRDMVKKLVGLIRHVLDYAVMVGDTFIRAVDNIPKRENEYNIPGFYSLNYDNMWKAAFEMLYLQHVLLYTQFVVLSTSFSENLMHLHLRIRQRKIQR